MTENAIANPIPAEQPKVRWEHEELYKVIQNQALHPPEQQKKFQFILFTLASALVYGGLHAASGGLVTALLLVVVLAVHELGHVIAMKLLGYKDVGVLFVPFFGALTKGEPGDFDARKQAVVALAGPGFGLAVGVAAAIVAVHTANPMLGRFADISFGLNLLNLLPFWPLDGGRFFQEILFSRFPVMVWLSSVLGAGGLAFLGAKFGDAILIYFGAFVFFRSFKRFRWNLMVSRMRKRLGDSVGEELNLQTVGHIFNELEKEYPTELEKAKTSEVAPLVTAVWRQCKQKHPSAKETAILLAGAGAFFGAIVAYISTLGGD